MKECEDCVRGNDGKNLEHGKLCDAFFFDKERPYFEAKRTKPTPNEEIYCPSCRFQLSGRSSCDDCKKNDYTLFVNKNTHTDGWHTVQQTVSGFNCCDCAIKNVVGLPNHKDCGTCTLNDNRPNFKAKAYKDEPSWKDTLKVANKIDFFTNMTAYSEESTVLKECGKLCDNCVSLCKQIGELEQKVIDSAEIEKQSLESYNHLWKKFQALEKSLPPENNSDKLEIVRLNKIIDKLIKE